MNDLSELASHVDETTTATRTGGSLANRERDYFAPPFYSAVETICLNSEGEPWREGRDGYNGFISSFKKAKAKAGIEGVNFSDLRGTAVTRLALAGCTVPQICAITGHSHEEANRILEEHYLHRDPAIAWNAIRKLEAFFQPAPDTTRPVPSRKTKKI